VLSGFGKQLGGMSGLAKVATAGLATVAAAGLGLATGLVSSIGAAMDFESAMSGVAAVAGASDKELQTLSDTAIQLGQDTSLSGIGATEAATAMRELAAAGLSVQDIVGGGALGALRLASAGGIDVGRAAEIAAMALANFGLAGSDAAMVADLFASAANSSAISVDDIAEAMKYVGPIANSMGLSIEEVTATIAALGNQGIKGSAAGTALRSMLVNLASPSKQASKIIKELGLEFFDTNGQMKSLADVSGELRGKMEGLTDQQRAHALSTLFGNEALTAATVLYGEGAAGINKWLHEIENGATAAQVGAMRNNNLKGSIEALKGSFETAQIALGMAFLPALKQLVDLATQATNASIPLLQAWGPRLAGALSAGLGALPGLVERAGTAIGSLVTAFKSLASGDINGMFGPILKAIEAAFGPDAMARASGGVNTLLTALEKIKGVVVQAKEAFNALPTPVQGLIAGFLALGPAVRVVGIALPLLVGALTGLGPIVGALSTVLPVLGSIIAALGAPITALVVIVGALAVAWATNWMGIRDATMPIIQQIVTFITGTLLPGLQQLGTFITTNVVPAFMAGWTAIQTAVTTAIAAIMPLVQQFSNWFTVTLLPAIQQLIAVAVPAFEQMRAAVVAAFEAALPGILAFIAGVQQLGVAVLPILQSVATTIMDTLGPAVMAIVDWATTVIPQFAAAWENVMAIVGPIIGGIADFIGATLSLISDLITEHTDSITSVFEGAWDVITGIVSLAFGVISGLISAGLQAIAGDWSGAWDTMKETASNAWDSIKTIISGAWAVISGSITIGASVVLRALTTAWEGIKTATGAAWDWIKDKISQAVEAVKTTASNAWESIKSTASSAWEGVKTTVSTAMTGMQNAVAQGIVSIVAKMAGLAAQIVGALAGLYGRMYSAGRNAVQGLLDGLSSLLGAVQKKAGELASAVSSAVTGALGIKSPSTVMREYGQNIVQGLVAGMDDKEQDAAKKAADVASAIAKAVTDTLGALKALANFDFVKDSPSGEAMGWFRHLTESMLATMQEAAAGFEEKALEHTGKFADTVGKVGGSVKNAVDGLLALGKADWANSSPTGNAMGWFMHLVQSLVQNFVEAGANFEEDGLKGAERFAEAVGKVTGVISGAVTGLQSLAKFVAPAETKVSDFMRSLADLMEKFGTWAGRFEEDSLQASARFAEAAGKVVGILDNGVKGLMSLDAFVAPAETQVTAFMTSLSDLMEKFGTWAGNFEQDVLDSTSRFAEAAGKVAGVIGPAVDGFAKLATLAAPSETAISQLAAGIRAVVKKFSEMATMLDAEGTEATGKFAEAAGKALGAAKTGVELFAAMSGDKDKAGNNQPVGIPSAKAIDELSEGIKYVIRKFAEMARSMEDDGIKQMQAFASAAGQVLSAAKTGTDLFKQMEKLAVPSAEAIDYLLGTIGLIITKIRQIAAGIGTQGLAEAQAFATGSLNVISALTAGLKEFEELAKWKDLPAKQLEEMWKGLEGALSWARDLTARASAIKSEAEEFLRTMQDAARAFAEGMSISNGMSGTPALSAPLGVGGNSGGGSGTPGGVSGPIYEFTINGDIYDGSRFEDRVVSAISTADRRGR